MDGSNVGTEKPPADQQPPPPAQMYPGNPAVQSGQQYPQQGVPPAYTGPAYPQPPIQGQPYAPAQPGYPAPGQPGYTVVATQPATIVGTTFRETSVRTTCPACQADVMTSVSFETGLVTWLACLGICGVGLFLPCVWLGCCFIPFCVPACKDAIHRCPNCQNEIGRYKKM